MREKSMTKFLLGLGAVAVLASAAVATPHAKKPSAKGTPTSLHCPVMAANKVDVKKATADKMFADYKGNRYFFCCAGCPEAFKKNPAKYAKADHIPTPKPAKKG
jgi:YHS domain-containing protein